MTVLNEEEPESESLIGPAGKGRRGKRGKKGGGGKGGKGGGGGEGGNVAGGGEGGVGKTEGILRPASASLAPATAQERVAARWKTLRKVRRRGGVLPTPPGRRTRQTESCSGSQSPGVEAGRGEQVSEVRGRRPGRQGPHSDISSALTDPGTSQLSTELRPPD